MTAITAWSAERKSLLPAGILVEAASMWRSVARSNGVAEGELTLFEPALDRGIDALVDAAR